MNSVNNDQEKIYRDDDGEYINYCTISDKLCIDRYFNNHLKSETLISNISEKHQ